MLPKNNRLNKNDIEILFKKSFFANSQNLTLKFLNNQSTSRKIAFITPKNVSKLATKRNSLRRKGYSVIKKYFKLLPQGFVGVFIFGKKSLEVFGVKNNTQELENEIKTIFNKINIKNN